ncbi:MAG: carboxypeptidase regulatory-like domain-containing protein [Lachnospiraceae bacterium]|nr:carboxypeptidase regulatory-like domain-containing protein [Lachnospiraceae bacterium]
MDRNQNEEKKSSSKTITTVILSAVVFIAVAFGAYFVIRNVFLSKEIQARTLAEEQFAKEQAEKEEEAPLTVSEEEEEPEEEEEEPPAEEEEPEVEFEPVDPSEYILDGDIVDYSVTAFVPAKRDQKLRWKDTVFLSLENLSQPGDAKINTLSYSKRRMKTADDKEMEYEVYTDPDTGVFSKITAIENCGDYSELTDYYFDSEAKLNYAASCRQFVLVPFDISTDQVLSRYYITDDTMVRYIYAGETEAVSYELSDYEKYSEGTKDQYDYLEKEIINRAYITYQACSLVKEKTHIHGFVLDEFNQPLSGIRVSLLSVSEDGEEKRETEVRTDGDGEYDLTVEASDQKYALSFEKQSLEGQKIYGIRVPSGSGIYYADTVYMGYTDNKEALYNMNFYVRDVFENTKVIDGAEIRLRSGIHNQNGELITFGYLDENGAFQYGLSSGSYTAEIVKEGYETSCFTVIVKQDHQAVIGYAVPEVPEDRYVAFVYWEKNPLDLDARIFSQYGKTVARSLTESIGAITTENFTLDHIGAEPYKLYVSDYIGCASGDNMSYNLSESGAYAKVYSSDGELASYEVPLAHAGVVWDALTIRNGKILPDGRYYYIYDSDFYWTAK